MSAYLSAMSQYTTFSGRASRAEFWKFTGIYMLGALIIICIETFVLGVPEDSITVFYAIYMLVHVLPGIAVTVRRLHDIDRNGAWFLLLFTGIGIIVLLVFMLTPGIPGPNRFGPAPEAFAEPTGQRIEPHDHRIDPHAHAHAYAPEQPHQRAPAAQGDPIAEIERLAHLRAAGGLTDAEFEVLKARALSRLTAN